VLVGLNRPTERRFAINLLIAFLPAAIVGLLFHDLITAHLFNPRTVAMALIVGGVLILAIERLPLRVRVTDIDRLGYLDALKIGIAQVFSLFPGVSRAGATIMGGLLSGLSRTAATEFSFFLAMPVMFAATFYSLYKHPEILHLHDLAVLAVGFVMSFFTALVVVRVFLRYVSRHDFTVFAWYRIVFGGIVLYYYW
jgi:undecaprenyl-diphosphatase